MAQEAIKVAFDTNIWVSFAIGKKLEKLREILTSGRFHILICDEIIEEFIKVVHRDELLRFISEERISDTLTLIECYTIKRKVATRVRFSRDPGDDFLLAFASENNLRYLITGDKDLLVIKHFKETSIIDFSTFVYNNF